MRSSLPLSLSLPARLAEFGVCCSRRMSLECSLEEPLPTPRPPLSLPGSAAKHAPSHTHTLGARAPRAPTRLLGNARQKPITVAFLRLPSPTHVSCPNGAAAHPSRAPRRAGGLARSQRERAGALKGGGEGREGARGGVLPQDVTRLMPAGPRRLQ